MTTPPTPDAPALPWTRDDGLPLKPQDSTEYGFIDAEGRHPVTYQSFLTRFDDKKPVFAVWTPESPRLVAPEQLPFLYTAIRRQMVTAARDSLKTSLAFVAIGVVALVATGDWRDPRSVYFLGTGLALLYAASRTHDLIRARAVTPERMAEVAADRRHGLWLGAQKYEATRWISWVLIACFAVEYLSGGVDRAVYSAGLIRSAARLGQLWRLVTGPMLHAGPVHFFFNYGALLAFGRLVEAHAGRWYLPLVFLLSAIGGSVMSVLLTASGASVGASGGLMGLLGFLAVLGWRRRPFLPPGFMRTVALDIAGVGVLGIIGFAVIDNAAHFGGLVTGTALGALLVRREGPDASEAPWSLAPSAGVRVAGMGALGGVAASALLAMAAMFGRWQ